MKKIAIILFLATLAIGLVITNLMSFGRATGNLFNNVSFKSGVKGSGHSASQVRELHGFHALNVGGAFEIEVTAQRDFRVEVEADDNILGMIRTEVDGGVLRIHTEGKISTKAPMKIRISAPNIDDVELSGAGKMTISGIKNESLNIESSGASKVTVSGETAKLRAEINGATRLDAEGLKTQDADVEANGASKIHVNVAGELRADANGASQISYSGSPTRVEKKSNGASSVSPK